MEFVSILLSGGAGADVMKRIAAPMVGGVISALLMALIVFPAPFMPFGREDCLIASEHLNPAPHNGIRKKSL